jgi:cytochrome P450
MHTSINPASIPFMTTAGEASKDSVSRVSEEYKPFDPPFRDNPFPTYARARKEQPVFYSQEIGMWIVTRYDDVAHILKKPHSFSSTHNFDPAFPLAPEVKEVLGRGYPTLLILINSDPPDHTRLRQVLSSVLTETRIAAMESSIQAITNQLIDTFFTQGKADLISQLNAYLPISVMGNMLGLPPEDLKTVHRMCRSIIKLLWWNTSLEERLACAHDVVALQHYLASQIERRRSDATADMLTDLVQAKLHDDTALTTSELVSLTTLLLFATTGIVVKFLGNAEWLLLSHPEQLQALKRDRSLMPGFVEESIRMEPSLRAIVRTAQESVEIGGVLIPAGDRLLLHLASANRDENHFANPDDFNIQRERSEPGQKSRHKHLGLGHGVHYCAGAPLGRLICGTAIQTLLERLPDLRLQSAGDQEFEASLIYRGLQHLHVEWNPETAT